MRLDIGWTTGHYGAYVLSTYAASLLALLWMGIRTHRRWRSELRQARRRAQASGSRSLTDMG
jgi:heme exporter protein D